MKLRNPRIDGLLKTASGFRKVGTNPYRFIRKHESTAIARKRAQQ